MHLMAGNMGVSLVQMQDLSFPFVEVHEVLFVVSLAC